MKFRCSKDKCYEEHGLLNDACVSSEVRYPNGDGTHSVERTYVCKQPSCWAITYPAYDGKHCDACGNEFEQDDLVADGDLLLCPKCSKGGEDE
jgi:hypothetical protein